ncbi:MAG TPA: MarR family winged helix-turn-helix transcriptional regulator [Polyangia bacterium]|nr:MarR family winged helix-turn-helix transcriptional regulator [Polyangia bacterium]
MTSRHPEAQEIASDCLASRARRLDRLLSRIYDGALRGQGVTGAQLGMLVAIELGGPTTAAWVGRRLELEKSTVSRNLARLEAAGLVDGRDGLRVTARGAATIRACHPLWRRAQKEALAALGAPTTRLLAAIEGTNQNEGDGS